MAARIRQVRKRRDWKPADLARRCAELGAPELTENVIENIESRSRRAGTKHPRPVTVDELLALAAALNVPAVSLLVDPDDLDEPYSVTATVSQPAWEVRGWICALEPLAGDDPRQYYAELERGKSWHPKWGIGGAANTSAQRRESEGT